MYCDGVLCLTVANWHNQIRVTRLLQNRLGIGYVMLGDNGRPTLARCKVFSASQLFALDLVVLLL